MRVLVPLGTRPEIVKLAPVVAALVERGVEVITVATGQHYDPGLTDVFFADLGLHPDDRWTLPDTEADRVGAILSYAFSQVDALRPDLVLVQGDTYTVPLFCLAARRHCVPVAHLEAGLRSFNERSMEEVDRRIATATASLHFAPTPLAASALANQGVASERIRVVGNPVLDVLRAKGVVARPVSDRAVVVCTAHRSSNVDDPARLRAVVEIVQQLSAEVGAVTFPLHPRTRRRLEETNMIHELDAPGVTLCPPAPYDQMLDLLAGARVIVTDSGGLQEEAAWLGVPVVVLRQSTPRWEGVAARTSVLTGLDVEMTVAAARRLSQDAEQHRVATTPCPYGDGHTAPRVADIVCHPGTRSLLDLVEPDFTRSPPPR